MDKPAAALICGRRRMTPAGGDNVIQRREQTPQPPPRSGHRQRPGAPQSQGSHQSGFAYQASGGGTRPDGRRTRPATAAEPTGRSPRRSSTRTASHRQKRDSRAPNPAGPPRHGLPARGQPRRPPGSNSQSGPSVDGGLGYQGRPVIRNVPIPNELRQREPVRAGVDTGRDRHERRQGPPRSEAPAAERPYRRV